MPDRPHTLLFLICLVITHSLLAAGCSSTTVTFHAAGPEPPLCRDSAAGQQTAVYWGAAWRPDQKETGRRESIAAKGIDDFFRSDPCFSVREISRTMADEMSCC